MVVSLGPVTVGNSPIKAIELLFVGMRRDIFRLKIGGVWHSGPLAS